MRLDYDLIREILLKLEELISIDDDYIFHTASLSDICSKIPNHSRGEILYTLFRLSEGGYIELTGTEMNVLGEVNPNIIQVTQITFSGHQYIDSIRDNKIWTKVKGVTSSLTLSVIQKFAMKLIEGRLP